MTTGEFFATLAFITLGIWLLSQGYDKFQIWRGAFPKPSETTLDDIRRLRDQRHLGIAVKRFQQMPENRGVYTEKAAFERVRSLKLILPLKIAPPSSVLTSRPMDRAARTG